MIKEVEKKVIKTLVSKGVSKEDCHFYICALTHANAYDEMCKWLEENSQADVEDIRKKILSILGVE